MLLLVIESPNVFSPKARFTKSYNYILFVLSCIYILYLTYSIFYASDIVNERLLYNIVYCVIVLIISIYSIVVQNVHKTKTLTIFVTTICFICSFIILTWEITVRDKVIRDIIDNGTKITNTLIVKNQNGCFPLEIDKSHVLTDNWHYSTTNNQESFILAYDIRKISGLVYSVDIIPCVIYDSELNTWRYLELDYVDFYQEYLK